MNRRKCLRTIGASVLGALASGNRGTTASPVVRAANGHPGPYRVRYWSIGNESWGCGGHFEAEDYARHYARFVTYLRRFAEDKPHQPVEFIACGDTRGDSNQKFFDTLLRQPRFGGRITGVHHLSIHHYFRDGPAIDFTDDEYYGSLASVSTLEELIQKTIGLLDYYAPGGNPPIGIALDEWGVWHPGDQPKGPDALFQSNTLRDAILAAVVLNSLNQTASRVSMANIAQTFNVLQCMAFTRGPLFVLTPTYHVFDLYQPHMETMALKTVIDSPTFTSKLRDDREVSRAYLSASASMKESERKICVTLVNQHLSDFLEAEIHLAGLEGAGVQNATRRELSSPNVRDENTFENPSKISATTEEPVSFNGNRFVHLVPARSVQTLLLSFA